VIPATLTSQQHHSPPSSKHPARHPTRSIRKGGLLVIRSLGTEEQRSLRSLFQHRHPSRVERSLPPRMVVVVGLSPSKAVAHAVSVVVSSIQRVCIRSIHPCTARKSLRTQPSPFRPTSSRTTSTRLFPYLHPPACHPGRAFQPRPTPSAHHRVALSVRMVSGRTGG
jgi:hypothetical protein